MVLFENKRMKLKTERADLGLTGACQTENCRRGSFFMLEEYIFKCLQILYVTPPLVNAAVLPYDVGLNV